MIKSIVVQKMQSIKKGIKAYQNRQEQIKKQQNYRVRFYNCWEQPNEEMYWRQFIEGRGLLSKEDRTVVSKLKDRFPAYNK